MSDKGSMLEKSRVGPYRILRRLRGVTTASEVGRVYKAYQAKTGKPALVVRGVAQGHYVPEEEWQLRVRAAPGPDPYVALEVERAPQGNAPMQQLEAGLDALACALEGLEKHPEAAAHLRASPVPSKPAPTRSPAPSPRWSWQWVATAAVLAGMVVAPRAWRAAQPAPTEPPAQAAQVAAAEEALSVPQALPVGRMVTRAERIALDMPKQPFPGQWRTDADGKCKGSREVPINGGCWVALDGKAPCGDDAYEWKGKCYWPAYPPAKEPSSILPRPTPVPAQRAQ